MTDLMLAHLPTPLERADRLGAALALPPGRLWVKRDDCTGLATGGNKVRKLRLFVADALATGCDARTAACYSRVGVCDMRNAPRSPDIDSGEGGDRLGVKRTSSGSSASEPAHSRSRKART